MPGLLPLSIPGRILTEGAEGTDGTGSCVAGGVDGTEGVGGVGLPMPGRTFPLGRLYIGPDIPGRVGGGSKPPG